MIVPELQNRFTYHAPKEDQIKKYEEIRDRSHKLAQNLNALCPDSREKSLAITKLEEVVFWANASIARDSS